MQDGAESSGYIDRGPPSLALPSMMESHVKEQVSKSQGFWSTQDSWHCFSSLALACCSPRFKKKSEMERIMGIHIIWGLLNGLIRLINKQIAQWVLRKRARSRPETGSQDMNPRPEGLLPGYESSQPLKGPAAGLGDSRKLEELEGSGHLLSHKPPHAQVPAQE